MGMVVIEAFADVGAWTAHRPDGSPSTAVSITAGGPPRGPDTATPTALATASAGAAGHYLERTGGAVDLRPFTDLQLWVRGNRPADGSDPRPFFAEVRAGSPAAPIASQGNTWHRLIPVAQPGVWQPVPLSVADLPAAVRAGMTALRLTSLLGAAWSLGLDQVLAVRDDMIADVDDALRARLDGTLRLNGNQVPAIVVPTSAALPAQPLFRISNYDVQPNLARSPTVGQRTDHTETGFVIRRPAVAYDLYYAVEAMAADRATASQMLDFLLAALAPVSTLVSRGRPLRVEWVDAPSTAAPPVVAPPADHPVVHLRVFTSQPGQGAPQRAVPAFNAINVEVDHRAATA